MFAGRGGLSKSMLCLALCACALCVPAAAVSQQPEKKGILVVSFGTSYEDTLARTIVATENAIARAFPDFEVRRAFTSGIIIKILNKRGIAVDTVVQALEKMRADGFTELVVQPLHLMPGEEFHELLSALAPFRAVFKSVVVGMPLFSDTESYFKVAQAIGPTLPPMQKNEAVLFMGHGSRHPANAVYFAIQRVFSDMDMPVYIATVEGYPILDDAVAMLKRDGISKVTLLPLMLVAGDHANNDMAGDEPDSWKSLLRADGFQVETILRGLGENPEIQKIYVENITAAIDSMHQKTEHKK